MSCKFYSYYKFKCCNMWTNTPAIAIRRDSLCGIVLVDSRMPIVDTEDHRLLGQRGSEQRIEQNQKLKLWQM